MEGGAHVILELLTLNGMGVESTPWKFFLHHA